MNRRLLPLIIIGLSSVSATTSASLPRGDAHGVRQANETQQDVPSATTDDKNFTVRATACARKSDPTQLKVNRVDCTLTFINNTKATLKGTLNTELGVYLVDDTGTKASYSTNNQLVIPGFIESQLPTNFVLVFLGASEKSTSATLVLNFGWGTMVYGYNGGNEHLIIRNIPLHAQ
jgi:hypothetical protein